MRRLLVLGATSAIAQAVIRLASARGDRLHLVARDLARLDAVAADARVRRADAVSGEAADLGDPALVPGILERAVEALGGPPELVLIAYGILGDETAARTDAVLAQRMIAVNFTSVVVWCEALLGNMEAGQRGGIAVIGSVAGDRGRASVAIYGAAKAGLDAYLAALRHRLAGRGPRIITIKPGYVDSPMTAHLRRNPLFAPPSRVAPPILRALDGGNGVAYVPWFWRWIMLAVRLLPTPILHRLRI